MSATDEESLQAGVELGGETAPQPQYKRGSPESLVALGGYKPLPGILRLYMFADSATDLREYAQIPFPKTYEVRCV